MIQRKSCKHGFTNQWEFGPIITEPNEKNATHWFYKKCSKCGEIKLLDLKNIYYENNLNLDIKEGYQNESKINYKNERVDQIFGISQIDLKNYM
jgi:hypothetical protein